MAAAQRIVSLSAADLVDGLNSAEVKPEDLASACIARFEEMKFAKLSPPLLTPTEARERTSAGILEACSKKPAERPPLAGVPFLVSDTINSKGLPTTASNEALTRWAASRDAAVVARLKRAGGIFMTKTSVHELSLGCTTQSTLRGPAENPWSAHGATTGGAAGGAAAAVAARVAPLALAVDSTGDARAAAACCGTVAYRPSLNRYPTEGVLLSSSSLDVVSVMARTVEDVVLADTALCKRSAEEKMDEQDEAESQAAVRIQAIARARRDRGRVQELKEERRKLELSKARGSDEGAAAGGAAAAAGAEERKEEDQGKGGEEESKGGDSGGEQHHVTYGEAEAAAATKVQAIIRGKQGRTKLRAQLEQEAKAREDEAALRIQAIARGRLSRKKVTELQTKRAGAAEAKARLRGARVGISRGQFCKGADPCVMRSFDETCAKLAAEGAEIVELDLAGMDTVGRKLGLEAGGSSSEGVASGAGRAAGPRDPSFAVMAGAEDGFSVPAVASKVCEVVREHELLRELGMFIAQQRLDEDREVVDDTPAPKGEEEEEEEEAEEEEDGEGGEKKPKMMTIRTSIASVIDAIKAPSEEREVVDRGMRPVKALDRASYLYALVHARDAVRAAVETAIQQASVDCVLYPTCLVPAAVVRGASGQTVHCGTGVTSCQRAYQRNASVASCMAGPAVSVPCGFARLRRSAAPGDPGSERVPVGMELMATEGKDDRLLEIAAGLEACMPRLPDPILRGTWRSGVVKHA